MVIMSGNNYLKMCYQQIKPSKKLYDLGMAYAKKSGQYNFLLFLSYFSVPKLSFSKVGLILCSLLSMLIFICDEFIYGTPEVGII